MRAEERIDERTVDRVESAARGAAAPTGLAHAEPRVASAVGLPVEPGLHAIALARVDMRGQPRGREALRDGARVVRARAVIVALLCGRPQGDDGRGLGFGCVYSGGRAGAT